LYWDCKRGISRGCPLSPLLGAVFLNVLDAAMEKLGLFYVRFMEDMLVLAPTRWKLKTAVKRLNEVFNELKVEKYPDKTFIGRIEKGFDFLSYYFSRSGLQLAAKTIANAVKKMQRLYEQKQTAPEGAAALDDYLTRWARWTTAGLNGPRTGLSFPATYTDTDHPQRQ
jgi:RNA-directed DNA polymerase